MHDLKSIYNDVLSERREEALYVQSSLYFLLWSRGLAMKDPFYRSACCTRPFQILLRNCYWNKTNSTTCCRATRHMRQHSSFHRHHLKLRQLPSSHQQRDLGQGQGLTSSCLKPLALGAFPAWATLSSPRPLRHPPSLLPLPLLPGPQPM